MSLSRNIDRLSACIAELVRRPRESAYRVSGLRELARGAGVARRWLPPAGSSRRLEPAGAAQTEHAGVNPLHAYVHGATDGPGPEKWRHYLDPYHRHLRTFVGRPVVVVDVGLGEGGSLRMWRHYFGEHSRIHGVDIREACRGYHDSHTTIHIGDQADRAFWKGFRESVPVVDVLVDDGGHDPEQQMVTLEEMLHHLRPGGVYICEDVIGIDNRFAMFARSLAGELNACAWTSEEESAAAPTPFQTAVDSIHLYPFLLVIEKRRTPLDELSVTVHGAEAAASDDATRTR